MGRSWSYPADRLWLAGGSGNTLLFEELDPGGGRPGRSTGRYRLVDYELASVGSFQSPAIRFGPEPLVSPAGQWVVTVTSSGEQFALQMFALDTGQLMRTLPLPLATSSTVSIRWHEELLDSLDFAVVFRLAADEQFGVRTLRVRLPWNGDWPVSLPEGLNAPRNLFFSPEGNIELTQDSLRTTPATALGGGESWPAVDLSETGERRRIRSALLTYGDAYPDRRWTADGTWFFTMTASDQTEGPGWERITYSAWRAGAGFGQGSDRFSNCLRRPAPDGSTQHNIADRSHPTDPTLLALGRLEAARFVPDSAPIANRIFGVVQANVTSESGPDHLDPWCGNPNELVFALPMAATTAASPRQ
jgi:hypothetical protein